MSELVLHLDDQLALQLSQVASEHYDGDRNAAIADALLLLFLQPIVKKRRSLAKLIYEIRRDVQAAGGVKEKDIARLVREYRQSKRTQS